MTLLGIPLTTIAIGVALAVVTSLALTIGIAYFVARLPEDFLSNRPERARLSKHRWHIKLLKNIGGAALLIAGLLLAFPGVPGPGLVIGAMGFLLLDFPGKHRLERRVLAHPRLFKAVNRLRERWGRPPLEPAAPGPAHQ